MEEKVKIVEALVKWNPKMDIKSSTNLLERVSSYKQGPAVEKSLYIKRGEVCKKQRWSTVQGTKDPSSECFLLNSGFGDRFPSLTIPVKS
ncbi:hypothetical protein NPIL_262451 [Nephila pilipes]|uniref:Uncharacterized protein n=1 Tax=Nephila pilipes TaxID=299642 RepID=A0A8X6PYT5_NEPPI|nr:hypothetical protein NPIL_262451 [Nephila pilipes]